MSFWKKKKIAERDLSREKQERQSYISSKLEESEAVVSNMREAANFLGTDLNQGNIGAAAITARTGGFSQSVTFHLDCAETHHRQDYGPCHPHKTRAESRSLAQQEIAKAGAIARRELKSAVNKSKDLRQRLRDT